MLSLCRVAMLTGSTGEAAAALWLIINDRVLHHPFSLGWATNGDGVTRDTSAHCNRAVAIRCCGKPMPLTGSLTGCAAILVRSNKAFTANQTRRCSKVLCMPHVSFTVHVVCRRLVLPELFVDLREGQAGREGRCHIGVNVWCIVISALIDVGICIGHCWGRCGTRFLHGLMQRWDWVR